ncbi:DMT family transporter [Thalassotalea sp. PLHSN55]|uniref:DMT family transporter n=1 Tax=Thalassotalea sp. PLHSN55 TaxID=3435888 RepID=UPI003F85FCC0
MSNSVLYFLTVVIWGSTWIAINYQLGDVAPEASLVYRFALAALLLFAYCSYKKLTLSFNIKQHASFALFGICLFGLNYYLLYNAQMHINSALTSIAFSTLMLANIINARIWYKTKITAQVYLGGALGLCGIVALFWPQISDVELGQKALIGLSLSLIGTLCASFGNMISMKNQQLKLPLLPTTAWGMAYGALFMTILLLMQGKSFSFSFNFAYISSLLYLSVFGSVIAFACYLTLLTRLGAHKTSYASIMFPAVAVVISTFVENFHWSSSTVIGFSTILIGNLVLIAQPKHFRLFRSASSSNKRVKMLD